GFLLCETCLAAVEAWPSTCPACAGPSDGGATHPACRTRSPLAGQTVAGVYGGPLAAAVRAFKYRNRRGLARPLAELLAAGPLKPVPAPELVVPVPLHPDRARSRGYNQAALLGKELAHLFGVHYEPQGLIRTRPTVPQVGLSAAARRENVRGAFRCPRPELVSGRRIWLVDDVITTGATVTEAARTLRRAGACQVWAVAVAHD
ncbi:MAG: amidophosphoribosyltransferase, partial [Chloroflexota bacterium]